MLNLTPIKARLEVAHGAPWNNTSTVAGGTPVHFQLAVARTGAFGQSAHLTLEQLGQIADFLLNAPTDVAALVAEIEALRTAILDQRDMCLCLDLNREGPAPHYLDPVWEQKGPPKQCADCDKLYKLVSDA